MAKPYSPDVELYYISRSVKFKPNCPQFDYHKQLVSLKGLRVLFLWLVAIDNGFAEVRMTYKVGKQFLVSVIQLN